MLSFSANANYYLTNERQATSADPVTDCNGYYGTSCDPVPQFRFVQRSTWTRGPVDLSYNWRYVGGMDAQKDEASALFGAFQSIDAYNYIDLSGVYRLNDNLQFQVSVDNVFDETPPIVGSETGSTSFNSGNTFPSLYDVLGRTFQVGAKMTF
jgi:outer membrane receptor protein involved in Fe transport